MTQATLTDIDRGLTCLLRTQHSQLRLAGGNHVGGAIGYAKEGVLEQVTNQGTLQASSSTHVGGITGYAYESPLLNTVLPRILISNVLTCVQ